MLLVGLSVAAGSSHRLGVSRPLEVKPEWSSGLVRIEWDNSVSPGSLRVSANTAMLEKKRQQIESESLSSEIVRLQKGIYRANSFISAVTFLSPPILLTYRLCLSLPVVALLSGRRGVTETLVQHAVNLDTNWCHLIWTDPLATWQTCVSVAERVLLGFVCSSSLAHFAVSPFLKTSVAGRNSWIGAGVGPWTDSGTCWRCSRGSDADLVAVVESAELRRFPLHRGRPGGHTHRAEKQSDHPASPESTMIMMAS